MLRESLLEVSQLYRLFRSLLISEFKVCKELEKNVNVVSSAKIRGELCENALGKSLIYIRNRIGPRTEPWGTPHRIGEGVDELF